MLKKKFTIYIFAAVAMIGFVACGGDDPETDQYISSSTAITGFSLQKNDKALQNLDSVFFSIDLVNAKIYNADSLPFGTNVSRIPVTITTNGCKALTITQSEEGKEDVVVDYLNNSTDSIDFTKKVTISMTSINGLYTRDYDVRVNVHLQKPDSMRWAQVDRRQLPTSFTVAADQRTVEIDGTTYCLTRSGSAYCIAMSTDLENYKWTYKTPAFGMTPDVKSFTSTAEALYILSTDGDLYRSTDGESWTSCSTKMTTLITGYESTLLGLKKEGDAYYHVTYPATTSVPVAATFPVSGMSQGVTITSTWSPIPQ
ncbi:MAG: hypothetical protein IKX94_01820, partial [Muribaculaceae bacterium]|nr:hypothetical protein [Muribaculaceae bacterium]